MEGTGRIVRTAGVFSLRVVDRAGEPCWRSGRDGEIMTARSGSGRSLSAALSPQIHTAQHLFPPGTGAPCLPPEEKKRKKNEKKKGFRTPLSELLVSELAFDIEPRGAIPGVTSENKSGRGRSEQLVAIGGGRKTRKRTRKGQKHGKDSSH